MPLARLGLHPLPASLAPVGHKSGVLWVLNLRDKDATTLLLLVPSQEFSSRLQTILSVFTFHNGLGLHHGRWQIGLIYHYLHF